MNKIPFVDLSRQYRSIQADIEAAIAGVFADSSFILGPAVDDFEKAFAQFLNVAEVVGVGNGLDALRLALSALGVGPGDEVILPVNTYIATALAVSAAGAKPVLVDCDPASFEIVPGCVEAAITPRTKAVIPVHLTRQAAPMDAILAIGARHSLSIIEDAAQAHGTAYKGARCGSIGELGCFSFYPGKNLGACGDGGGIATNNEDLARRLRELRNNGQRNKYHHVSKGLNSRLDSIQAAILKVKLAHLEAWNTARRRNAAWYRALLNGAGDLRFQEPSGDSLHNYHLFVVTTEHRDRLRRYLEAASVETGIHYPRPIHCQPAYADLNYMKGQFPHAERLARTMLSLPMFPELRLTEIEYVANVIRKFFGQFTPSRHLDD